MDIVSREQRSAIMSRIRGKNTKPELAVRRAAHGLGYRYRLHRRDLPGSPDLVFAGRRKVVFVHGCYWHRHEGCRLAYEPKSNEEFWKAKFAENVSRDQRVNQQLGELGWGILTVWGCEAASDKILRQKLNAYLSHAN